MSTFVTRRAAFGIAATAAPPPSPIFFIKTAKGHGYKIAQLRIARGLNQTEDRKSVV